MKIKAKFILFSAILLAISFMIFRYVSIKPNVKVKTGALKTLSTEEKLEDFRYMYSILKENFPYFQIEQKKTGYDWLQHKPEFEEWIKNSKNNEEFYFTLNKILTLIQNGHTNIIPPNSYDYFIKVYQNSENFAWKTVLNNPSSKCKYPSWANSIKENKYLLPFKVDYIEGHYTVRSSSMDKLNASIISSINDVPIDEYIKTLIDKHQLSYDFKRKKLRLNTSSIPVDNEKEYKIKFITPNNEFVTQNIYSLKLELDFKDSIGSSDSPVYSTKILEKNKIAYMNILSLDSLRVEKDRDGIYNFLKSIKDYPYLVIDIRGNGGGDTSYWLKNIVAPLAQKEYSLSDYSLFRGDYISAFIKSRKIRTTDLSKAPNDFKNFPYVKDFDRFSYCEYKLKPENPVGFKGKIFLLVDSYVYSSSETLAVFCKSTGFAKVVGTTTGGDGIGIDPCLCALPNSGLIFRFPLKVGLNPDGSANEETHTSPDIYVEQSYEDYVKLSQTDFCEKEKFDSVLNKVLQLANQSHN